MFPKSLIRSNLIVGQQSSKSRIPAVCPLRTGALRTVSQGISSSIGKENSKNPFLNPRSRRSSAFHFRLCLLIVQLVKLVQPLNLQTPISFPPFNESRKVVYHYLNLQSSKIGIGYAPFTIE